MQLDQHSRTARILTGGLCILAALLLTVNPTSQAGGKKSGRSDDRVKVAAAAGPIDVGGKQTLTLILTVDKGWHIYANPVKCEEFEDNATRVKLYPKVKLAKAQVQFPTGMVRIEKELNNLKMMVYEGTVKIPIVVHRAAGDTAPIEIAVTFNACDDKNCLFPATVKVTPK